MSKAKLVECAARAVSRAMGDARALKGRMDEWHQSCAYLLVCFVKLQKKVNNDDIYTLLLGYISLNDLENDLNLLHFYVNKTMLKCM